MSILLLVTSIVFINAQIASKNKDFIKVKKRFLIIGFLSFTFLLGQIFVWNQLINLGYFMATNPANAYFYLFTTLHGLHLMGGLIYWNMTLKKVLKPREVMVEKTQQAVELCAIYWHFLFIVWLVLFGLMLLS